MIFQQSLKKDRHLSDYRGIENAVLDKIVSQDLEKHGNHLIMG